MNRVELKENAKKSLNGKLSECIKIILMLGVVSFAAGFVGGIIGTILNFNESVMSLLNSIISTMVSALTTFGLVNFYLKMSRDEEVTWKELFNKTNMWIPFIIISIVVGIFTFLWSLLFIIPGIIAALSYSMVYYIALDNPELSPMECIKESKRIMNGHKMDYFVLQLSFIGWIILGAFTLGILYFWLMPYMSITQANFYNSIKE